jgi:hypothetical protein
LGKSGNCFGTRAFYQCRLAPGNKDFSGADEQ